MDDPGGRWIEFTTQDGRTSRMRVDQHQPVRRQPARDPAPRHGEAHLAGPDQHDGTDILECLLRQDGLPCDGERALAAQASPTVSNSTLSSASAADLPAQTTNWKA